MVAIRIMGVTLLLAALSLRATAEEFTNAIHAFLHQRIGVEGRDAGMVIAILDEHGSSIVSCGKMADDASPDVNGDTLFEIGSITKTFTTLLLQDMVERGEMRLDDPVAKYLPKSVKLPTHNGREITLLQLATHTSGLPDIPDNITPKNGARPLTDYTADNMYAFLSGFQLTRDPGAKHEYSSLGIGLLSLAIALKAGTNYESLVVDRICRPLKMDSTRITLTPELKSRFVSGHNQLGEAAPSMELGSLAGAGALRSTANDLLKYMSAQLGLTPSSLTPLMKKTHEIRFEYTTLGVKIGSGLAWVVEYDTQGRKIISHTGGTFGCSSFAGFDPERKCAVVILCNSQDFSDVSAIGRLLLESEWPTDRRPKEEATDSQDYDSYVGQYQLTPNFSLGMLTLRLILQTTPKAVTYTLTSCCLAELFILLWRAGSVRKRWIILAGAGVAGGLLPVLLALALSHVVCSLFQPVVGVRREAARLFTQVAASPIYVKSLSPIPLEILRESKTRFFNRLTGLPLTFYRDDEGRVNRLTEQVSGAVLAFVKISDQSPEISKPHAYIKLDPKLLDACAGQYVFAPNNMFPTGVTLTIRREGSQLVGQGSDNYSNWGVLDIYPESETVFFGKRFGAKWMFIKDANGEAVSVIVRVTGLPSIEGIKLKK